MDFIKKKLPRESAGSMRRCPIASVSPYTPMLAPMYVYMKQNEKFVSIKAPMDFFLPEEIERLRPFADFYCTEFIEEVLPFRDAACRVRAILNWVPQIRRERGMKFEAPELALAPFEISDIVLRVIGPLWGKEMAIEPYFIVHFAQELCGPLPGDRMIKARESGVPIFEIALMRSAWAVFLGLILGHCQIEYLAALRAAVFERSAGLISPPWRDFTEMAALMERLIPNAETEKIEMAFFGRDPASLSEKLSWRLRRVDQSRKPDRGGMASIFGPKGFAERPSE